MAISPDLIEVFNNCIDLLNRGETIDSVLSQYPAQASQLRPMLEAGQLLPRARYGSVEVSAAQDRIEPVIERVAETTFRGGLGGSLPGLLLIAAIIGGGILIGVLLNQPENAEPVLPLVTETLTMTVTDVVTVTSTPTVAVAATVTSTATIPPSEMPTDMPTATPAPTDTRIPPSATFTSVPPSPTAASVPPLIVIEGPVEAIDDDGIVIYDTEIEFDDDDDTLLDAIQVGDVIRIEGQPDDESATFILIAINIIFVDSALFVDDASGEVWRDDESCANPPPAWAPAHGWRQRCEAGNSNPGVNPGGGDNDDDDDDGGGDDDDD